MALGRVLITIAIKHISPLDGRLWRLLTRRVRMFVCFVSFWIFCQFYRLKQNKCPHFWVLHKWNIFDNSKFSPISSWSSHFSLSLSLSLSLSIFLFHSHWSLDIDGGRKFRCKAEKDLPVTNDWTDVSLFGCSSCPVLLWSPMTKKIFA